MNSYSTSPIKRKRRSKDEVYHLFGQVVEILEEYNGDPITIRIFSTVSYLGGLSKRMRNRITRYVLI